MDEDIEEDVDFEEYRLPGLGERKGKKAVGKGKTPKAEKHDTSKSRSTVESPGTENEGPEARELGAGMQPGAGGEQLEPGKSALESVQGAENTSEAPELSEQELAEVLEDRNAAKQKEEGKSTATAGMDESLPGVKAGEAVVSGSETPKAEAKASAEQAPVPSHAGSGEGGKKEGVVPSPEAKGAHEEAQTGAIERVSTGVEGLDELVEGGLPTNSLVLVKGCAGAGKSIFGMNFLMAGIANGEKACFFSLEEPVEETKRQMLAFGWNLESLESQGVLAIKQPELYEFDDLLTLIEETVKGMQAKRLVFDSISVLGLYFQDEFKLRRALIGFERMIKRTGCTTLVLSESSGSDSVGFSGVEEFVVDGVIKLGLAEKEGVFQRAIYVAKMRATNHSLRVHPFQIESGKGIVVYPGEKVLGRF